MPITNVSTMMPITSSIMAAESTTVPTRPLSFPNSRNVSTVIDTLVAVMITPINTHFNASCVECKPKNGTAMPNPSASGTKTPASATKLAFKPERFSSPRSVSSPAPNMMRITPSSAKNVRNSVERTGIKRPPVIGPHKAGPTKMPAKSAPTTCGKPSLFITSPNVFVATKMMAKSNKNR